MVPVLMFFITLIVTSSCPVLVGITELSFQTGGDNACDTSQSAKCYYYIAVYGVEDSDFTITATDNGDLAEMTIIASGVPVNGHVDSRLVKFERLSVQLCLFFCPLLRLDPSDKNLESVTSTVFRADLPYATSLCAQRHCTVRGHFAN